MKKYIIDVAETYKRSVEIEAETEDSARDIITKKINTGDLDIPCDGGDYDYECELFASEVEENEVKFHERFNE